MYGRSASLLGGQANIEAYLRPDKKIQVFFFAPIYYNPTSEKQIRNKCFFSHHFR